MKSKQASGDDATFSLFETAYHDYVKRLGEIWEAMTKRVLDAQKQLNDAGTGKGESADAAHKALTGAHSGYVDAVRAAWDTSQKDYTAAYDTYVRGFRDAWGKIDVTGLTPSTLTTVTQGGSMAAAYAASTIGNWQLISWAGVPPWVLSLDQRAAK